MTTAALRLQEYHSNMGDLLEEIDLDCEKARTNNFPPVYRLTLGADMMKIIGEMDELLWMATKSETKRGHLYALDAKTQRLKRILRKAMLLKLISTGQHEVVSRKVKTFGGMVGRWIEREKERQNSRPRPAASRKPEV